MDGGGSRLDASRRTCDDRPVTSPAPSRTQNPARDAARLALETGTADPMLAAFAAACRTMRHRGATPEEIALLLGTATKVTDVNAHLGARDYAWKVGDPGEAPPESPPTVPEIDVDDLFGGSPQVARMARWVAGEVVCGPDLPVMTILAIFSAAVAVKAIGHCGTWKNPPNLFLAAEVASGENKSRVRKACQGGMLTKHANGAVANWHTRLAAKSGGRVEELVVERKIREDELRKLKRAAVVDVVRTRELGAEIHRLNNEIKVKPVPVPGWLQVGKITSAQYMREMEIGGFVACFPDEGKETLWTFVGENGKGDIAPLLCGFTGEQYANSTVGAEQRGDLHRFPDYRATVWLPLQLGVLTPTTPEDARMLATLADRGFLARFLISRPRAVTSAEAPVRRAQHAAAFAGVATDTEIEGPYKTLLGALLFAPGEIAEDGDGIPERRAEEVEADEPHPLTPARPWKFTYTPTAEATLLAYQTRTRDSAKKGGAYDGSMVAEFVSRLADHAHRLATLLAIMRRGGIVGGGFVETQDVERAIRFLDGYALPHTLAVYARATFAPVVDDAETVLRIVRSHGELTKRELHAALPLNGRAWDKLKGGDRQTRLDVALESLERGGRVTLLPIGRGSVLVRYVGQ